MYLRSGSVCLSLFLLVLVWLSAGDRAVLLVPWLPPFSVSLGSYVFNLISVFAVSCWDCLAHIHIEILVLAPSGSVISHKICFGYYMDKVRERWYSSVCCYFHQFRDSLLWDVEWVVVKFFLGLGFLLPLLFLGCPGKSWQPSMSLTFSVSRVMDAVIPALLLETL